MTPTRLQEILSRAFPKRILVIGDLMLDEFVWGRVGRISPEAPVPVVEVTGETFYAGGAANVARNLREFIERVGVIGLMGTDRGGTKLHDLLLEQRIDTAGVIRDGDFPTIVKTRIIARNQQVVRIDREQFVLQKPKLIGRVAEEVRQQLTEIDAIILEDYGKGFLGPDLVSRICDAAHAAGKIVAADPNPRHSIEWKNVTVVKPNRAEAFAAAGMRCDEPAGPPPEDTALLQVGGALLKKWQTQFLLITLGEQGMMLFQENQPPQHIPTKARQVFDVSGAGDTAVALFTLALCGDASASEAAEIATHASAVVVGKLGTATVTPEELHASFLDDGSVE